MQDSEKTGLADCSWCYARNTTCTFIVAKSATGAVRKIPTCRSCRVFYDCLTTPTALENAKGG